jgi:hypothetical protein
MEMTDLLGAIQRSDPPTKWMALFCSAISQLGRYFRPINVLIRSKGWILAGPIQVLWFW